MRDQLVALARLAAMDASTRDLDKELSAIPARIDEMRSAVQTLETLLSHERSQLEDARRLQARAEEELRERADALARARSKVGRATNLKEADAAEREVDSVRHLIRERESELERIRATIDAKATSLAAREKEFEEARALFMDEEKQAKARVAELEAERAKVVVGRDELTEKVGKALMKRYDRIRTQRDSAVAIIEGDTCTGCRMAFPAQFAIELRKGEQIMDCPVCRRIVIHKSLLD